MTQNELIWYNSQRKMYCELAAAAPPAACQCPPYNIWAPIEYKHWLLHILWKSATGPEHQRHPLVNVRSSWLHRYTNKF